MFQPIGLRFSLSNGTCAAISLLASPLANQDIAFWANQTIRIWSLYV